MLTKLTGLFFILFCMTTNRSSGNDHENDCPHYYSQSLKKKVYTTVKIEPEFSEGEAAFYRFLNRNLRYPQEQIDLGTLQSAAWMKFIVDTDGQILNPTVNDKSNPISMTPFEKEVFRVIKLMPKWAPGKCQGKTVAVELKRPMMVCLTEE
jgi:hypothetical protein